MKTEEFINALCDLGWKQSQFSRRTGVSSHTVSRWKNGHTPIPKWVFSYLTLALKVRELSTYI